MQLYLWPASETCGLVAGRKNTQIILKLAGFKNMKSKVTTFWSRNLDFIQLFDFLNVYLFFCLFVCQVIGSHNPYNTIKAVFMALNAVNIQKKTFHFFYSSFGFRTGFCLMVFFSLWNCRSKLRRTFKRSLAALWLRDTFFEFQVFKFIQPVWNFFLNFLFLNFYSNSSRNSFGISLI